MKKIERGIKKMTKCKRCRSKVFFVDETITYLEVDGETAKELGGGDLHNRNCVRCNYPEQYENYESYDKKNKTNKNRS